MPNRHTAPSRLIACLLFFLCFGALLAAAEASVPGNSMAFGDMFGGDAELKVGKNGTIRWLTDAETGELSQMVAKRSVTLRSDRFNLDCDSLTYDAKQNKIIALGDKVRIEQPAQGMLATCRNFHYYPEQDGVSKAVLTGNPVMTQRGGQVSGETITIIQSNGAVEVLVDAGEEKGVVNSNGEELGGEESRPAPSPAKSAEAVIHRKPQPGDSDAKAAQKDARKEEATPIRSGDTSRIPEVSIDD